MKAVPFKGYNTVVAKDQKEYLPLPALVIKPKTGLSHCITCWEFTEEEMMDIAKSRKVFVTTQFGKVVPPMMVASDPDVLFLLPEDYEQPEELPL